MLNATHLDGLPLVLGATAGILLTPVVTTGLLAAVGFSAAGPVAGKALLSPPEPSLTLLAASIQSGIGNVVAGSLFATCQSVAMGGAIPTVVTVIGAGVGTAVGALVGGGGSDGGEGDEGGGDENGGDGSDGASDGDGGAADTTSVGASVTSASMGSSTIKKSSTRRRTSPRHSKPHRSEKMPTRIQTPPPSVGKSRYLAVVNPYPLNANLELDADRRALALWLACCAGKNVLRAMFYRPSVSPSKPLFYFIPYLTNNQLTRPTKFPEMVVIEVNQEFDRFRELLGQHVWSEFLVKPTKEHRGKSSTVFYSTFNTGRLVRNGSSCIASL